MWPVSEQQRHIRVHWKWWRLLAEVWTLAQRAARRTGRHPAARRSAFPRFQLARSWVPECTLAPCVDLNFGADCKASTLCHSFATHLSSAQIAAEDVAAGPAGLHQASLAACGPRRVPQPRKRRLQ